jgi:coproporphyrinogen III oxidase-like Fe-S oxidoreductase
VLPPDETLWNIQEAGKSTLATQGLMQYEVSAYAKPDRECIHNKNYWEFGDYLGIGAGAHSKITNVEKNMITRHAQVKHPKDYLNPEKSFTATTQIISEKDVIFEFMLNALRLNSGVSRSLFTERTGLPASILEPILSQAKQKNLLVNRSDIICATPLGQRFLNDAIEMFLK